VNAGFPHLPAPPVGVQVLALATVSLPLLTLAVGALAPATWRPMWALGAAGAAALFAAALTAAGAGDTATTIAKLLAAGCAGLALAALVSAPLEVAAIAVLVAVVDIYSVAVGPTRTIVHGHREVLGIFTLGLHPPGRAGEALLGVSDMLFFGLFCAATLRLALRPRLTWAAMTASFGATLALAFELDVALPALPLLSLAFLGANADLLLRRARRSAR
jgi:hypothetical protein